MNVPLYSVDTHVQYWHIAAPHHLSGAAKSVFDEARAGRAALVLSHVVIAELFYLFRKQGLTSEFTPFVGMITVSPAYRLEGISIDDLRRLPDFDEIPEMHDRLIAIQADRLNAPLVTKDASIRGCSRIKTLW